MCGVAVGHYRYSVEPAQQGQEVTHSAVCSTQLHTQSLQFSEQQGPCHLGCHLLEVK